MTEKITKSMSQFEENPSWREMFDIALEYFNQEKYAQTASFLGACFRNEIPNEELFKVYKLSYEVCNKMNDSFMAGKYFNDCMSLEKRDHSLIDDYKNFNSVPVLYFTSIVVILEGCWFDSERIKTRRDGEIFEKESYILVLKDGVTPDPYSLQIAWLTMQDNMKEMVMLADNESYIVSERVLKKLKLSYDYLFLKEEVEKHNLVMTCHQATLKPNEQQPEPSIV